MRATVVTSAVLPGQHPGTHRHAVAGDRERDDHLRLAVASLLAVRPALAQRRVQLAAPGLGALVFLDHLDVDSGAQPVMGAQEAQVGIGPAASRHDFSSFKIRDGTDFRPRHARKFCQTGGA